MKAKKRLGWKFWGIVAVALVFQFLFDPLGEVIPFAERIQAQVGLPWARAKWEAQKIDHYRFDIQGYVPLLCIFGGNIEVADGIVIKTGPRSDAGEHPQLLSAGLSSINNYPLCNARHYTMAHLFEAVAHLKDITNIAFDPRYGFVSAVSFGSSGGHGLFSPIISDCCGGFSIENFQVLDK